MSIRTIVPCPWFDDQAEPAARFYTTIFPGGRVMARSRYPESFDNPDGRPRGSVLTVDFEVAGCRFAALNGGPLFVINPTVSFVPCLMFSDRQGGRAEEAMGTYAAASRTSARRTARLPRVVGPR